MRLEVKNRLIMLGEEVVAEIPASTGLRHWVMMRPNDQGGVMVVEFQHDASVDTDSYFGPDDVQRRTRIDFDSVEAAIESLELRGIDSNEFDAPWKSDYPL